MKQHLHTLCAAVVFLLPVFSFAQSPQCDGPTPGGYTFCYGGAAELPTTNCEGTFSINQNTLSISPVNAAFNEYTFDAALTGYNMGDGMIPAGTSIEVFYRIDYGSPSQFDTVSFVVTYVDANDPTFASVPPDISFDCLNDAPAPPSIDADDLCDASFPKSIAGMVDLNGATLCGGGTIIHSWTATDASGNSTTVSRSVTINGDDDAPIATVLPQNATSDCTTADYPGWLSDQVNDIRNGILDCGGANMVSVTHNGPVSFSGCGTVMVDFYLTDPCGNADTLSATYSITDSAAPTFTVPITAQVSCELASDVNAGGVPTNVQDDCDPAPQVSSVDMVTVGGCAGESTIIRTWTVTDQCGNASSQTQEVNVVDQTPPTFDAPALDTSVLCTGDVGQAFQTWMANRGGATASDNCNGNLTWIAFNAGTTDPPTVPGVVCNNGTVGVLGEQSIDFIVTDECGNPSTTTATFRMVDNDAPLLTNCPTNTTLPTDPGTCLVNYVLPLPVVTDNCPDSTYTQMTTATGTFTAPPGDALETPVSPLTLSIPTNGAPETIASDLTLTIDLTNVDAEAATEFFRIRGEDGSLLGQTANSPNQCENAQTVLTIPAATAQPWTEDGMVEITLEPNIPADQPGRFAVNDVCGGSIATATLDYSASVPGGLQFSYRLNGGTPVTASLFQTTTVPVAPGANAIEYTITDCAGNASTCVHIVTVEDEEPPMVTCPADVSVAAVADSCFADVMLTLPTMLADNCGFPTEVTSTEPANAADALLTFSLDPNTGLFQADEKVVTFTGLTADVIADVELEIRIRGDVDQAILSEFFALLDENGDTLTLTNPAVGVPIGDCNNDFVKTIAVSAVQYNQWAADGATQFTLEPWTPVTLNNDPDLGINPCNANAVQNDGDNDGTSRATISLRYQSAPLTYSIDGTLDVPQTALTVPVTAPTLRFPVGTSTVTWTTQDAAGNPGTCTYDITVADNQPPTAVCAPAFVFINPSGAVTDTISPADIDAGSSDNCGIDTMYVTPNLIGCERIGDTVNVVLTVVDLAGNVAICQTFVSVQGEEPQPDFSVDCSNATLQLFANPPAAPGAAPYTYAWSGPNNFTSSDENPTLPDADAMDAGFYSVTITGLLPGCASSGTVNVPASELPPLAPTVVAQQDSVCGNQPVVLTVPGGNTTDQYNWYTGMAPSGTLIGITNEPIFNFQPTLTGEGEAPFYAEIVRNGCVSPPSVSVNVYLTPTPPSTFLADVFTLCAGDELVLEATLPAAGPNTGFSFSGPNFTQSGPQFKAVIEEVALTDAGTYLLVGTRNGCTSAPDTATLFVLERPDQPTLLTNSGQNDPVCAGETVTLSTAPVANAAFYRWQRAGAADIVTQNPMLEFANAGAANNGTWTVSVELLNGCASEPSAPVEVLVAPLPVVQADADPDVICEGATLQLNANSSVPNSTYQWAGPDNFSSIQQNPTRTNLADDQAGTYSVTVTTPAGCTTVATVEVEISGAPTISTISNTAPACPTGPTDVELLPTLFPADPGDYQYVWTFMGDTISNQPTALIPNATTADNGVYQLTVITAEGCPSNAVATILDLNEPVSTPDPPQPNPAGPACEGGTLTLTTSGYVGSVVYTWTTPAGTVQTTVPSLTLTDLDGANEGNYGVVASVNGCPSNASGNYVLTLEAAPQLTASADQNPICEGATVQLNVNCLPGATYNWQGPANFTASVCNPTVAQVDGATQSGAYIVTAMVNGCISEPDTVDLTVSPVPTQPALVPPVPVCGDENDVLLSLQPGTLEPGASYTFYRVGSGALGPPQSDAFVSDPETNTFADGSTQRYYVIATEAGCATPPSDTVSVDISRIPNNNAFAGPDQAICENQTVTLGASEPTVGAGNWTVISQNGDDAIITNPGEANTTVNGLQPGETYVFRWQLSNGACENYSFDDANVDFVELEDAFAGPDIDTCGVESVDLAGIAPTIGGGTWTQPLVQTQLGIGIENPNSPNATATNLEGGNVYLFYWTIDGGCGNSRDSVFVFVAEGTADAGADFEDCGAGCTFLLAEEPGVSNGRWTSPDPNVTFADDTDPATEVCGLAPGENLFVWTLDEARCGAMAIDTVRVNYAYAPQARDDDFITGFATTIDLDLRANDDIPPGGFYQLISEPTNGTLERTAEGEYTYTPNVNFSGVDEFTYELCLDGCDCSTATVRIEVRVDVEEQCDPPTLITPNGDNVNDLFLIPCLLDATLLPNNALSIFNEWGDEVFRAQPYRNDWAGTYNGDDLPPGTYFYIFERGDGSEAMTGFLVIQR